jgi:hypothetical protein
MKDGCVAMLKARAEKAEGERDALNRARTGELNYVDEVLHRVLRSGELDDDPHDALADLCAWLRNRRGRTTDQLTAEVEAQRERQAKGPPNG